MASKSRQAVGVATGGAVAGAHRRFGAKVNGIARVNFGRQGGER